MAVSVKKRGYTLIEVLIASAIFLVFVGAVFSLYVRAIKSYRFGEARIRLLQESRLCLDTISRDLKKASFVIYPDESILTSTGSSIIVYQSIVSTPVTAEGSEYPSSNVYALKLEPDTGRVFRMLYAPDFNVEQPDSATALTYRVIGKNIESLEFKCENSTNPQLVTIRQKSFKKDKDQIFLLTRIFIRY